MKKGFLGMVLLLSMQSAMGQDQPASLEKQNRLKKMTDFIVRNKACLSGTECSPRFSFFLNYMLGAASGLAATMGVVKAATAIGKKTGRVDVVYAAAISGGIIMGLVEDMGYSALIEKVSLKGINKIRCISTGDNCSLAQRRYLFFSAGSTSGALGVVAWQFLKRQFPQAFSHQQRVRTPF